MKRNLKTISQKFLIFISLSGVISLGLFSIVGTGGGGGGGVVETVVIGDVVETVIPVDSDEATEIIGQGSVIIKLKAVMGPIVGAAVGVSPIDETNNWLDTGTTEDSDDINEAGHVSLEIPGEYAGTPLIVNVNGGVDIDVDDNGVRDEEPTTINVYFEFVFSSPADLMGRKIVANPLLEYASSNVLKRVRSGVSTSVNDFSNPVTVRTLMRRVAKALIAEDLDGDGTVGWEDIVTFHPLIDQGKSNIPWEYVLYDVERSRQDYDANLTPEYVRRYHLDPQTFEPYDWDGDGDWIDDGSVDGDEIHLWFHSYKGGYTTQDLIDGQGTKGGKVTLPGNSTITYDWFTVDENGNAIYYTVENDAEPPLVVNPLALGTGAFHEAVVAYVGGWITEPAKVAVGEYTVEYSTGDGQQHQETIYLYENRSETLFYLYPDIEVNQEGYIESITPLFLDESGNVLVDPPILSGDLGIFVWDTVEEVNSLVRGEGFYTQLEEWSLGTVYRREISLVSPSTTHYPTNNGHKIYYEDTRIFGEFDCGDGTRRTFQFWEHSDLYPQLVGSSVNGQSITVNYAPAQATARLVVSIRYKFDNGDWGEQYGDTLVTTIPSGAITLYVTARDTSGFYKYPPDQIDLAE